MKIGVRQLFGYAFRTLFCGAILLVAGLYPYYGATRPRQPQPNTGRTVPLNNHGTIVYLTKAESDLLWWAFDSIFVLGPLAGIFFMSADRRP